MWNSRSDASETLGTDKTLYRSLEMGFEELERSNPIAAKILIVFSFLDHHDLWFDLCHAAIEENYPPWLQKIAKEKPPFKRYCPILADRSFIEMRVSPSGLRMWETHPAIQAVARDRAKDLELEYTRYAISLVAAAVPRGYEKDSWQKIRRLGPHVKLCWSYFKQGKWGPVANLNELKSLGRAFRHLGQYEEALQVYRVIERALVLEPSSSSDDAEFLANVLTNLGLVYVRQQRFEQALDSFNRSFNLMQQIDILTPNAYMSIMYNKAVVYMMTERLDQAEELLRDAAAHFSEHTIDEHSLELDERKELYFRILNDLGEVLLRQGYWQAAMEIFDDIHDCCKNRTGDPILFSLKLNIGRALTALGNFSKARLFFTEVVTVYTEWWGRHHPETMRAIEELARAFIEDGNQKQAMGETGEVEIKSAKELLNEVLGFYRTTDGDESEGVIRIEANLQYLSGLGQPRSPWYLEDSDW